MFNDEIKINYFKKKNKKNQHTLTFKINESGHELETNTMKDKPLNITNQNFKKKGKKNKIHQLKNEKKNHLTPH